MPVIKREVEQNGFVSESLRERLLNEWRKPHQGNIEPVIVQESERDGSIHLYVVWKDWEDLSMQLRSQIIMDSFEDIEGRDSILNVTVALGLTPQEAERMGIQYR